VFIPLEAESLNYGQQMIFKETQNPKVVKSGDHVFTGGGFLKIAGNNTELTEFVDQK